MRHGLKCSKCRGHNAEKRWGYNPRVERRYHTKHCYDCGNDTPKVYYGQILTQKEYDCKMAEFYNRITETEERS